MTYLEKFNKAFGVCKDRFKTIEEIVATNTIDP